MGPAVIVGADQSPRGESNPAHFSSPQDRPERARLFKRQPHTRRGAAVLFRDKAAQRLMQKVHRLTDN